MGACGWVNNDYIDSSSVHYKNDYLPPLGTVQGINADGLNLRARPSTKGEILARYPVGTRVEILGVIDSWAHVCLQDGKTDYMMLKYLGSEPEKAAKNSFTLLKDVENLRQGDRVRISVRPAACYQYADGLWYWEESPAVPGGNAEAGAWLPADSAHFW